MAVEPDIDATTTGFGSTPPQPEASDDDDDALVPGTTVDRYVVIGRIGRGGMGTVYAAWDPDLGRRVALKLLHRFEGPTARERLFAEARALARLRHPHVVTAHDVGDFGDRVFLAMDFVEGPTLRGWLEQAPSRTEVLAVLVQAGRGLAAAHAAGVVHRDFKPDNVLVELTAHGPVARVIDFGLAATGEGPQSREEIGADDPRTLRGAGTPAYMAPELFEGEPANARSDQWSFAKVCAEALTGRRLPRSGTGAQAEGAGGPRRVLARALASDPHARWPDMATLLDALERGRRRRRWIALGLGVAGLSATAVAMDRDETCSGADAAIAATWNPNTRAALEQTLADAEPTGPAARDVLLGHVDAWAQDWVATHREACASVQIRHERSPAFLDGAMLCLEHGRIRLAAVLHESVSVTPDEVWKLVDLAAGLPTPAECRMQPVETVDSPDALPIRSELARARTLLGLGRHERALESVQSALDEARRAELPVLEAEASLTLGEIRLESAAYDEARVALARAMDLGIRHDDPGVVARAIAKRLALEGFWVADDARADALAELGASYVARAADPVLEAQLEHANAMVARRRERYVDARAHCQRAFDLIEGSDAHARQRWVAELCVADMASRLGEADAAAAAYASVRDEVEARFGPTHPMIATALQGEGKLAFDRRDLDGAERAWTHALAIVEAVHGSNDERSAGLLANLAVVAGAKGRPQDERAWLQRALAAMTAVHGPRHPDVAQIHNLIGASHLEAQEFATARTWFERAIEALGDRAELDETRALLLGNIGMTFVGEQRPDEARPWIVRGLELTRRALGERHPKVAFQLIELAECDLMAERFADAADSLREAATIHDADPQTSPMRRARLELRLSQALHGSGGPRRDVLEHADRARELLATAQGDTAMQREEVDAWSNELRGR